MRIGINASNQLAAARLDVLREDAQAARRDGFRSWWLAQINNVDALTAFVALGDDLPDEVGTAVIPTWTRHPSMLAGQALTAQAAIGARLVLGIGLAHQPMIEMAWNMRWEKPVRHMSEYLDIVNQVFTDGAANVDGEIFTQRSMGAASAPRPTEEPPSLMVAALGPQMLDVCGRKADGTILWMVGPKTIAEHIAPVINEAAAAADRPAPRIVCSLPIGVTDDPAAARAFADKSLAIYGMLPSYRAMLDREGAAGPGDVSLLGSEAEVFDRLSAIREAGATDFTAVEFAGNPDDRARTRQVLLDALGQA